MFKITEAAAQQILKAAQQNEMTHWSLRLAAQRTPDGSIDYGMGFDEKHEEDIAIISREVEIIFHPNYQELLQGAMMDFVELTEGDYRFIFLNPNDPHYIPPNSGGESA